MERNTRIMATVQQGSIRLLSESDKSLAVKYRTVFDYDVSVIISKDKRGNEILEMGTVVGFGKTPLFEKVEASEIRGKIEAKLIVKL